MRNIFYGLVLMLLTSCLGKSRITPGDKATKLIKDYLDSNLVVPESYEPIEFRKMYAVMTTFYDNADYDLLPIEGRIQASSDSTANYKDYRRKAASGYYVQLDQVRKAVMDSMAKAHKPKLKYYRVVHTFKADRGSNNIASNLTVFTIDPSLSKIVEVLNAGPALRLNHPKRPSNFKPHKRPSPFKLLANRNN